MPRRATGKPVALSSFMEPASPLNPSAAIAVEALNKSYGRNVPLRRWLARGLGMNTGGSALPAPQDGDISALRDVTFQVGRGEAFGIIGRNGAGKSTLLQLLAGTLQPTSGRCVVQGRVTALLELGSGFNPEFTGRENIYLSGAIYGISRTEMDRKFEAIAQFADIGSFIDVPVRTYSTGMLMRVAFAVAASVEPSAWATSSSSRNAAGGCGNWLPEA
jgi:ABC-type polysaccharide/polyol phosphate transport system ATPase subunit